MALLPKIYVREKVFIPIKHIRSKEDLQDAYTKRFFDDKACKACDYLKDRFCDMCEVCPAYKGTVKLYSHKNVRGINYIGLPIGDKRNIEKYAGIVFEDFKIVDRRKVVPFDYKIKFLIKLRPHQQKLVDTFFKKKYGLIEAPPRFGKTVCMLDISIKLGNKTLVLASQHEFLQQYIYHIEGNEKKGIPKCTNLPELQLKYKKKLYGFPKTDADFENFQIFTMTYHQFMDEVSGKNRFKKIEHKIGLVEIDEAHKAAAAEFSKVVSMFPARYRLGVTGTVDRKDGRHYVIKKVIGPVVARSAVESMTPKVFIHETGIRIARVPKQWTFAMLNLARNKKRNDLLIKQAVADVKAGHSVVIPLMFKKHVMDIVNGINDLYGRPIAEAFMGGGGDKNKVHRDNILSGVSKGKIKVVVGIRSLLQLGLNVPRWSMIYTAMPISNEPNYKQETSRVRTPMEGKLQPVIRLFYDEAMGPSVGCARNCVTHMQKFKYEFSKDQKTREALAYFATKGRRSNSDNDDDQFAPSQASHDEDDAGSNMGRARAGRR
jgi:superfamily II DNA or RNA helicase